MPENLEVKASVSSLGSATATCRRIHARKVAILKQTDTYFHVHKGRLKLRENNKKKFELIYYLRDNTRGSRYSDYVVIPLEEPRMMKSVCTTLFGVSAIVKKSRVLYLYKNARIHLDTVRGLGLFVEFEVLVKHGKKQAKLLMDLLLREFGLTTQLTIPGSYADMLQMK